MGFAFLSSCKSLWDPRVDMTRVSPGQYFIKACFKFGLNLWNLFFSHQSQDYHGTGINWEGRQKKRGFVLRILFPSTCVRISRNFNINTEQSCSIEGPFSKINNTFLFCVYSPLLNMKMDRFPHLYFNVDIPGLISRICLLGSINFTNLTKNSFFDFN